MPLSRREFTRLATMSALTAAAGGAAVLGTSSAALAANAAYVFGYFKETPNESGDSYALHLAVSTDGLNWLPLNQNNPVVTPTAGTLGLRDPFILRKQDGTFVVLATDLRGRILNQNNQYLHVWDSVDLRSFTGYRRIRMHNLATHTWAPTAFWVASRNQYAIVYSANNGADVFMVNYTSDFRTVSADQVYFSPGFPVLDADIVADGSNYYMYYKNLSNGLIYGARSSTGAPNSYTTYTSGLRQGNAIEAPLLMVSRWGLPNWVRLKSFNFPDRYVRHAGGVGRIDAYPFDPHQDQLWRMVAGLADSTGVSFESVNAPGRYLRHSDYTIRLDANDGTATFRGDATFLRVAGLADPTWSSLRSYNFPDRYLRHANYVLRIDPLSSSSSASDRQDATFRVS